MVMSNREKIREGWLYTISQKGLAMLTGYQGALAMYDALAKLGATDHEIGGIIQIEFDDHSIYGLRDLTIEKAP